MSIPTEVWFPVVTLIGGAILAGAAEWMRDLRTAQREKVARNEERRAIAIARQIEFQRKSLLELQDAAQRVARTAAQIHLADVDRFTETGRWELGQLPEGISDASHLATIEGARLVARIKSEEVRATYEAMLSAATSLGFSTSKSQSDARLTALIEASERCQQRIGFEIRDLDRQELE